MTRCTATNVDGTICCRQGVIDGHCLLHHYQDERRTKKEELKKT